MKTGKPGAMRCLSIWCEDPAACLFSAADPAGRRELAAVRCWRAVGNTNRYGTTGKQQTQRYDQLPHGSALPVAAAGGGPGRASNNRSCAQANATRMPRREATQERESGKES